MIETKQNNLIVHIVTVPFSLGFLRGQSKFMRSLGFSVQVISSPGAGLQEFAERELTQVHAVPMERRITPFRDMLALWRLYHKIRALRPQIIHTHTPKAGLLGSMAAWLARVPVRIHTIHGLPMMTACGIKRLLLRWSEKITCWCAHRVFGVSRSIIEVAVQEHICPADKIKILNNGSSNGIDALDKFNPWKYDAESRRIGRQQCKIANDALVVGYVGRVVRDKGMIELAEAWRSLRNEFPTLHLLIVGPFEVEDPISQEVKTLFQNDPRIHLAGQVTGTPPYYAAMDVFTFPSYREGLGVAILEASAMELPVVATRIPGCVDAVKDRITGILVPPKNSKALADALRKYLNSPALRLQHGQAGRLRVLRDFNPETLRQARYEEYINLIRQKNLPVPTVAQLPESISLEERRAAFYRLVPESTDERLEKKKAS